MHKKTIDPVTGRMFLKHTLQDDLRDKRVREKAMVDEKASHVASHKETYGEARKEAVRQMYIRAMQMDESFAQFPSPLRREWSLAQGRLLEDQSMTDKERAEWLREYEVDSEIAKEAY